jgi:predicted GIY-YIG superfamily endonuclease
VSNYELREVAVYRCYDADARLLYVGVSFDPVVRMSLHRSARVATWIADVARVEAEWYDNRPDALLAERRATLAESPLHPSVVTGPRCRASALSGLRRDLYTCGLPQGAADYILRSSGYLDDDCVTPRSAPLDVYDLDGYVAATA